MTIAVHADDGDVPRPSERVAHAFQGELRSLLPRRDEIRRKQSACEQERARLLAEALDVQARPVAKRLRAADSVDAAP